MTVVTDTQFLLSLSDSVSQREWIRTYANTPNPALVDELREHILKIGFENPHSALEISELLNWLSIQWDDKSVEATYLHTRADMLCMTRNHFDALDLFERATATYDAIGQSEKAVNVAAGHIVALHATSRYSDAIALMKEMQPKAHKLKAYMTEGKMLVNTGNVYAELGQFAEAQQHYSDAHTAYEQASEQANHVPTRLLATLALSEGIALMFLNRFADSEVQFMSAKEKFDSLGMMLGVAYVNLNLTTLYHSQGDYQKALQTAEKAREQFTAHNSILEIAYIDLHRCPTYVNLTLWDEALDTARAARSVFEKGKDMWRYATTWINEGIALAHKGALDESISALKMAQEAYKTAGNSSWVAVAELYRASVHYRCGDHETALALAQPAQKIFSQYDYPGFAIRCLLLMGDIALAQHQDATAQTHFDDALKLQEQSGFTATRYACYIGLAKTAEQNHDFAYARTLYEQAINDIEQLQANIGAEGYKMAFLRDKMIPYERLVDLTLADGDVEQAFAVAERSKSRVLLDVMRHRQKVRPENTHSATLLEQFDTAQRELHWFYTRLNEPDRDQIRTADEIQQLNETIRATEETVQSLYKQLDSPDLADATLNPTWTVDTLDLLDHLSSQTILVEYFTIEDSIIAFKLAQGTVQAVRLTITVKEIAELLTQLRFQMNKFSYGTRYVERHASRLLQSSQNVLAALYDGLIRPLTIDTQADNIIIVPHNVLHYIPFHALFDGDAYLVDQYAVSTAPSGTVLYQTNQNQMESASVATPLIIGLADETIPHTEQETRAIAQFFPQSTLYLGDDATLETLKFKQPPAFLHLSTHAMFRTDNPAFSALKLSDGWFTVYDVASLAQSPPLVTLSGCETGRVNAAGGDELVGLSRGFFATGTRSLIMSLWMVEDGTTAEMMTTFYATLSQDGTVQHALRQAQLETKTRYPHPYYWASFTLSGSPYTRLNYPSLNGGRNVL